HAAVRSETGFQPLYPERVADVRMDIVSERLCKPFQPSLIHSLLSHLLQNPLVAVLTLSPRGELDALVHKVHRARPLWVFVDLHHIKRLYLGREPVEEEEVGAELLLRVLPEDPLRLGVEVFATLDPSPPPFEQLVAIRKLTHGE